MTWNDDFFFLNITVCYLGYRLPNVAFCQNRSKLYQRSASVVSREGLHEKRWTGTGYLSKFSKYDMHQRCLLKDIGVLSHGHLIQ